MLPPSVLENRNPRATASKNNFRSALFGLLGANTVLAPNRPNKAEQKLFFDADARRFLFSRQPGKWTTDKRAVVCFGPF